MNLKQFYEATMNTPLDSEFKIRVNGQEYELTRLTRITVNGKPELHFTHITRNEDKAQ